VDIAASVPQIEHMRKAALALVFPLFIACGTTCPEIAAHRQRFSQDLMRPDTASPRNRSTMADDAALADMHLTLPYPLLDELIAGQLHKRPVEVALPTAKLGLDLSLTVVLQGVKTHALESGGGDGIGVTLELGLFKGRSKALDMTLETSLAPTLVRGTDGAAPGIGLSLEAAKLGRLEPKTTPEGRDMLSRWLERELPPVVRALSSREVIDALADEVIGWLSSELWPIATRELAKDGPLFAATLSLPELSRLGLVGLATRSRRAGVVFHLVSGVAAAPLTSSDERTNPKRMVMRLSGKTATALLSQAMERGEVPGRFSTRGEPDKGGPWEARVGWLGGSRPLQLLLWRTQGRCERAEVGARVAVEVVGDELDVKVREGRLLTIAGPPFAEAFGWLETLFGKAIAFSFRTSSLFRFEGTDEVVEVRLGRVTFEEDLRVEFELGVKGR
jgi:hypothetical protein